MKHYTSIIAMLFMALTALSSAAAINYQAVLTDKEGKRIDNRKVGVKFQIVTAESQTPAFTEEVTLTTSEAGVIQYAIGSSTDMSEVNWGDEQYQLTVSYDLNGGTDYTETVTSQILPVPTAMYAEHSGDTRFLNERIEITEMECKYRMEDMNNYLQSQIINISTEISDHDQQINNNRASIEALANFATQQEGITYENRARIEMLEGHITYLMNEVENLNAIVNDLRAKVAELESR